MRLCMKMRKTMQKEGNIDILAYGERNLARNLKENDKILCGALLSRRERKRFEKLKKNF